MRAISLMDLGQGVVREATGVREPPAEHIDDAIHQRICTFGDPPVLVLGRINVVLAWNGTGHATFAGHLDPQESQPPSAAAEHRASNANCSGVNADRRPHLVSAR